MHRAQDASNTEIFQREPLTVLPPGLTHRPTLRRPTLTLTLRSAVLFQAFKPSTGSTSSISRIIPGTIVLWLSTPLLGRFIASRRNGIYQASGTDNGAPGRRGIYAAAPSFFLKGILAAKLFLGLWRIKVAEQLPCISVHWSTALERVLKWLAGCFGSRWGVWLGFYNRFNSKEVIFLRNLFYMREEDTFSWWLYIRNRR